MLKSINKFNDRLLLNYDSDISSEVLITIQYTNMKIKFSVALALHVTAYFVLKGEIPSFIESHTRWAQPYRVGVVAMGVRLLFKYVCFQSSDEIIFLCLLF